MGWLLLACFGPAMSLTVILGVVEAEGWKRTSCGATATVGVSTTSCEVHRGAQVAIVTFVDFERSEDARAAYEGIDGVARMRRSHVLQIDVFDRTAARALLAVGPAPAGFICDDDTCLR